MTDISAINVGASSSLPPVSGELRDLAARLATSNRRGGASPAPDSVELSDVAVLMSKLRAMPDVRSELVDRVRTELTTGKYVTRERLDDAIHALLDDLQTLETPDARASDL